MYYLTISYAKIPEGWGMHNSSHKTEEEAREKLEDFFNQAKSGLLGVPVRRLNWSIEFKNIVADGSYELAA